LTDLDNIRIVLVEPAGPRNVGAVARVMKNMGLRYLTVVNPHCHPLDEEACHAAVHAKDVLESVQVAHSLMEALAGCQRAIATLGRNMTTLSMPLESPRIALPWLRGVPSALIFGPEDRGLSNLELNYAQRLVSIPTADIYPSLNLAQAVGICCYELHQSLTEGASPFRVQPTPEPEPTQADGSVPIAIDALEQYLQHLETLLLQIGYLQPHTAESRMQKLRHIYKNAHLSAADLALLWGIVRQTRWAVTKETGEKL
jgi:tRNA/rRNA methyltransferase